MVKIKYSKELDLLPPRPTLFPDLIKCFTYCLPKQQPVYKQQQSIWRNENPYQDDDQEIIKPTKKSLHQDEDDDCCVNDNAIIPTMGGVGGSFMQEMQPLIAATAARSIGYGYLSTTASQDGSVEILTSNEHYKYNYFTNDPLLHPCNSKDDEDKNRDDEYDLSIPVLEFEISETSEEDDELIDYDSDDSNNVPAYRHLDCLLKERFMKLHSKRRRNGMGKQKNNKNAMALGFCQLVLMVVLMEQFFQISRRRFAMNGV